MAIAADQGGYFTAAQAVSIGYSYQAQNSTSITGTGNGSIEVCSAFPSGRRMMTTHLSDGPSGAVASRPMLVGFSTQPHLWGLVRNWASSEHWPRWRNADDIPEPDGVPARTLGLIASGSGSSGRPRPSSATARRLAGRETTPPLQIRVLSSRRIRPGRVPTESPVTSVPNGTASMSPRPPHQPSLIESLRGECLPP